MRMCILEGCTFTTTTIMILQKHYEQEHSLKEQVRGTLAISGNEYLPLTNGNGGNK